MRFSTVPIGIINLLLMVVEKVIVVIDKVLVLRKKHTYPSGNDDESKE